MTTNYFTAIATGAAANASTFNTPLGALDAQITTNAAAITANALLAAATTAEVVAARGSSPDLDARLDALVLAGGNVATKANGVSAAGQKVLTVDSTTGFIVGAYVTYLLNGATLEGNTIGSIQAGVSLTLGTNIGTGGVLDDSYISMISTSEYLAAQAIPHAGTLLLPETMEYANGGVFNVAAYGASPSASGAVNTAAINATISAATAGDTVEFRNGAVYSIATKIVLKAGITYKGHATIKADGSFSVGVPLAQSVYDASDGIIIDGITFDGNSRASGLELGDTYGTPLDVPAANVRVENCTFQNIDAPVATSGALFTGTGLNGGIIRNNRFVNCTNGIHIVNPADVSIDNNYFDTITEHNAITVNIQTGRWTGYGYGVKITGNRARQLSRQFCELLGNGSTMTGAIIADNNAQDWATPYNADPEMGCSWPQGSNAVIANNVFSDANGNLSYGIECAAEGSIIDGNSVSGAATAGVSLAAKHIRVANNTILLSTYGIEMQPTIDSSYANITGNQIIDCKTAGINCATIGLYGHSTIARNTITRDGSIATTGWNIPYLSIVLTGPGAGGVTVENNYCVQTGASPVASFVFYGIHLNNGAGDYPYSRLSGNIIASKSTVAAGNGIVSSNANALDDLIIADNRFRNLAAIYAGSNTPGTPILRDNSNDGCTAAGAISLTKTYTMPDVPLKMRVEHVVLATQYSSWAFAATDAGLLMVRDDRGYTAIYAFDTNLTAALVANPSTVYEVGVGSDDHITLNNNGSVYYLYNRYSVSRTLDFVFFTL